MQTYAEVASDLLNEAAVFFMRLTESNAEIKDQMEQNAGTYRQMAQLIKESPEGKVEHLSHGEMAGRLLKDAADFLRTIAAGNAPIAEQMEQNANVFEKIAAHVAETPTGQIADEL